MYVLTDSMVLLDEFTSKITTVRAANNSLKRIPVEAGHQDNPINPQNLGSDDYICPLKNRSLKIIVTKNS